MADGRDAVTALDAEDLAWLDARSRVRAPEHATRAWSPRRRGLLLVIALAHVGLALLVRESMRPPEFARPDAPETVLYLDFVADADGAPAPLDPATRVSEPARPREAPRRHAVRRASDEAPMTATFVTEEPAPAPPPRLRVFGRDGAILLPDQDGAATAPGYRAPVVEPSSLLAPKHLLPVRTTRFAKVWKPDGESLGQGIVRRFPLAGILLQGVNAPKCPPRSTDPECEGEPEP
jgi:hypothetical protein